MESRYLSEECAKAKPGERVQMFSDYPAMATATNEYMIVSGGLFRRFVWVEEHVGKEQMVIVHLGEWWAVEHHWNTGESHAS